MEHDEMVAELISRYPHREKELKRLDELLVYRDDEGVYGFEFDTCIINEIFIQVAEFDLHECDKDEVFEQAWRTTCIAIKMSSKAEYQSEFTCNTCGSEVYTKQLQAKEK